VDTAIDCGYDDAVIPASIKIWGYSLWYIKFKILGTLEPLCTSIIDSKSAQLPTILQTPRNSNVTELLASFNVSRNEAERLLSFLDSSSILA
jgi:hypothetical protein